MGTRNRLGIGARAPWGPPRDIAHPAGLDPIFCHSSAGVGPGRVQRLAHTLPFMCCVFSSDLTLQSCECQEGRLRRAAWAWGWGGRCKGLGRPSGPVLSISA